MDCDKFFLSNEIQIIIIDLQKNIEYLFDFSNLDGNHEIFSIKIKKRFGKFKIEAPKDVWIYEFICLRSKAY